MDLNPRRRPMRLPGADYTRPGAYFVTICTTGRTCMFDDKVVRRIVEHTWRTVIDEKASLEAGDFIVMPNHVHGIIWIDSSPPSPPLRLAGVRRWSLGAIVGSFKTVAARRINRERRTPSAPVWQRGYYDRIIRNEPELDRIRLYILENPAKWLEDVHHPENAPSLKSTR